MISLKCAIPLAVILLSATGSAMAADSQLSGSEIKAHVIGNTVVGVDNGRSYQEYYDPNGSISGVDNEVYKGAWRIEGDKLCSKYDDADSDTKDAPEWDCSAVSLKGDQLTWVDGDDDKTEMKLLPGKQLKAPTPGQSNDSDDDDDDDDSDDSDNSGKSGQSN